MKQYLFFDLDGTLADTDPDIRVSWKEAMDEMGLKNENFDRDFVAGPPIETMFRRLFPVEYTEAKAAELRRRFGFHYDHDGFPNTLEYPGVIDAVKRLKAVDRRVFIVTNKRHAGAIGMARHFGWDRIFERIYSGDMFLELSMAEREAKLSAAGVRCESGKMTKTELIRFVMAELGAAPEECLMIGDTMNDFAAAKANSVASLGVRWGYGKADEFVAADMTVESSEGLFAAVADFD